MQDAERHDAGGAEDIQIDRRRHERPSRADPAQVGHHDQAESAKRHGYTKRREQRDC